MTREQANVGVRVKALVPCTEVPAGTEGVIDERTDRRVVVAWDLPDRPLPPGYASFRPHSPFRYIVRAGFKTDLELMYLEVVRE